MKNNTFNYFRNAFALIGFFIIACSVATTDDDSPVDNPDDNTDNSAPITASNIGKYQLSYNQGAVVVMNTETGAAKFYALSNSSGWVDLNRNITFTH